MSDKRSELDRIVDDEGKLPRHAWPGGYAISYICEDGGVVCAKCANEWWASNEDGASWYGAQPRSSFIHWEGIALNCESCTEEIASEYGDPNEDEDERSKWREHFGPTR